MSRISALVLAVSAALVLGSTTTAVAATPTGILTGHVTVPAGGDITKVAVVVQTEGFDYVASGAVSASGDFTLPSVPAGTYVVGFEYGGAEPILNQYAGHAYVRDASPRVTVADGQTTSVDAALDRGAVLTVTLSDAKGLAVGATASIEATGATYDYQPINPLQMGQNGAVFTSWKLPPGTYRVRAGGPRWLSSTTDLTVGDGQDAPGLLVMAPGTTRSVDLTLGLKAIIHGTASVQTPSGAEPYTGYVTLTNLHDPYGGGLQFASADGVYDFGGLAPGEYQVSFDGGDAQMAVPTYYPSGSEQPDATTITVVGTEEHDLAPVTLLQGGMVTGKAYVQSDTGTAPAAQADVSFWKLDDATGTYSSAGDVVVDASGGFTRGPLAPGTYAVWARSADVTIGSEWYQNARYFADRTDVVVEAGQTKTLNDMTLKPRVFDINRIGGTDRFDTAVKITQAMYPTPAQEHPAVVYVVNGYNYPDALAAGPAAIAAGGAVLPVGPTTVPDGIVAEVQRLNPDRILVVGGVNAVSAGVFDAIDAATGGTPIARIGGATRYETGAAIVRDAFGKSASSKAIIATGANYPDALAADAAAGHLGAPVILVDGSASGLAASTQSLLADLHVTDVLIAGGAAAVSQGVADGLAAALGQDHVQRVAGVDRYQTAAELNAAVFPTAEDAYIASGTRFPDALAGGPLAGMLDAPLYLSGGTCIDDDTMTQLLNQDVVSVTLLGGSAVLGDGVAQLAGC
jgi:putative cell wall-binding protein